MRSRNAIKNLVCLLIYEALAFVLGIIFPRYIILFYGSEINGLTSTITRILSLINLIQAGAVGAAIFQMYKPVADEDFETQSAIIYSSRKFYNKVSIIYFVCAIGAGIFYSFYLKSERLSFLNIFLSFVILALNGTNVLLFNSICDIFISPHQKKYYLSIAAICEQIVRYSTLTIVLLLKLPFVFIYVSYLTGGIISVLMNILIYRKLSKGKISKNPKDKKYVIKDRKYLMLSSIGAEAVTASPTIIITTFIDLIHSSIFSVYALIFTSMKTILSSIQLSFSSIFGNLVKTSDDDRIYTVHSAIELITIFLGTLAASCVGFLILPFIALYTRGADVSYIYVSLGIFVVAYTLIFAFGATFGYVATVYGLFKDICIIVLVFGSLGIIISILCAIYFGMPFVMVGLIINQLGCAIANLIIIKKKVSWFKTTRLLIRTTIMVLLTSLSTALYFIINPIINSWFEWILSAFIVAVSISFLLFIYCVLFERKYLRLLISYLHNVFTRNKKQRTINK